MSDSFSTAAAFMNDVSRKVRICALLTCFNRRDKTLAALQALQANNSDQAFTLHAVLVDDGSTDGTAEAVRAQFPWVQVEIADGALFWCRGMHRAFRLALQQGYDYYLWLNDDTMLFPDTLNCLLACEAQQRHEVDTGVIVVGSTVDAETGAQTYGGERRDSWLRAMRFVRLTPSDEAQRCDSMTGNIVLINAVAAARVGNLDPRFEHAMGDTDYALRANRLGVGVWAAPGVHGHCSGNPMSGTFVDGNEPLAKRWRQMMSRKGLPWRSWLLLTWRHAGWLWPLHFVWPYARVVLRGVAPEPSKER